MANSGSNTHGSQLFLCLIQYDWLDGKYVVFGRVTEEGDDFLNVVESVRIKWGKTKKTVEIVDSYKHIILRNVDFIVQSQIITIEHAKLTS